jgi:hypothetical protein
MGDCGDEKAKNNTKGQRNKGSKGATGWCFSLLYPFDPLSLCVEKAFFANYHSST